MSEERPETCEMCGAPVVWCKCGMSEYTETETRNARALRVAVIKNLTGTGNLTREEALELLNAPLSPDSTTVYDDREKLDWSTEQFTAWMIGEDGEG